MKQFNGFPARVQYTPIPNVFFSSLLPQISDIAELKTTLHIFWMLYQKRGYPRFITYHELISSAGLVSSLSKGDKPADETLRGALEMATARGTVLSLPLEENGVSENIYFLNTESDRQAISKIRSGELKLGGSEVREQASADTGEQPDIFTLYEENIGMLTPMIAEELREAEKLYPESWLRDAIKEAVSNGKRKWSYISAILERWATEGRSDGTHQRNLKETGANKYLKQKYGHMVQR